MEADFLQYDFISTTNDNGMCLSPSCAKIILHSFACKKTCNFLFLDIMSPLSRGAKQIRKKETLSSWMDPVSEHPWGHEFVGCAAPDALPSNSRRPHGPP